jgi:hypothetical protein
MSDWADNYDGLATTDDASCELAACASDWADNFDSNATSDDGSCTLAACASDWADNFDSNATSDDGSCELAACASDWADNYDANATIDDGSCVKFGCMNDWADNYDVNNTYSVMSNDNAPVAIILGGSSYNSEMSFSIVDCDGNVLAAGGAGEYSAALGSNYTINMVDSWGDGWNGGSLTIGDVSYVLDDTTLDGANASVSVGECGEPQPVCLLSACMSDWADNYDSNATSDDGSCDRLGCMSDWADNYDALATTDNGSCERVGCTSDWADNYDELATNEVVVLVDTDNGATDSYGDGCAAYASFPSWCGGYDDDDFLSMDMCSACGGGDAQVVSSCELSACTSDWADNYDANATSDDGSCDRLGCMSDWADNYDGLATTDDGSCDRLGCMSDWADNFDAIATTDDGSCTLAACASDWADNFDSNATSDDGSCDRLGCMSDWADNFDALATTDDGSCDRLGCTANWADNYDGLATTDDNSCSLLACMDSNSDNYDSNATDDSGDCFRVGCTNEDSDNYDMLATDDSGDCFRMGCTNDWADNYDELATVADGSCTVFELTYHIIDLGSDISDLTSDLDVLQTQYDVVVNQYATLESAYDSCYAYGATFGGPVDIAIDIVEGWNMIGYTLPYAQDAAATLSELSNIILIVKNNDGSVYWPELGFNGIGDLIPGQGYQIKTTGSYDQFTYPDVDGQRIVMTPTVPDWAIEMEADVHPNDIRTLVKVVNMLGQEVNVADQFTGEVLLYLFNDGSVEKKIVK